MSGGHQGKSAADCPTCWEEAYEPGWYAILSAGDGVIQLPATANRDVIVQLPASASRVRPDLRFTHASVTAWRRGQPNPASKDD